MKNVRDDEKVESSQFRDTRTLRSWLFHTRDERLGGCERLECWGVGEWIVYEQRDSRCTSGYRIIEVSKAGDLWYGVYIYMYTTTAVKTTTTTTTKAFDSRQRFTGEEFYRHTSSLCIFIPSSLFYFYTRFSFFRYIDHNCH